VIHAEEISSPGAAAVTRGREASTNPARPNPRRRRIAPRIGPGWRQSARSGGGWPRGSGRRRESRALGFGGRANTRRKEEIDAGKKKEERNRREKERFVFHVTLPLGPAGFGASQRDPLRSSH
jgi:hypothetical protein